MKQLLKTVEQPNAKITQKIPAEVVTASRDINRLTTSELAKKICDVFYEMHGDRRYGDDGAIVGGDRKSTRLNSSHVSISYAVFCLKKKKKNHPIMVTIVGTAVIERRLRCK